MTIATIDPALVTLAAEGDARAVGEIVRALQRPIFGIALRMLVNPVDAEDATQEALVRVVTRLAQFRGESAFATWAYRIAVRRILDFRDQRPRFTTTQFADDLADGLDLEAAERPEDAVLHHELKILCSRALLQCLDGDHRIAFVLGEIWELPSGEAAEILEIDAAAFRKRLQRSRTLLQEHLAKNCGVYSQTADCRCHRRIDKAIALGRVEPTALQMTEGHLPELRERLAQIGEMSRLSAYYHDEPELKSKTDFVATIRSLLEPLKETV